MGTNPPTNPTREAASLFHSVVGFERMVCRAIGRAIFMENELNPSSWGAALVEKPNSRGAPLVLEASPDTSDRIHELAVQNRMSDVDLVRLGLALAHILTTAKKEGNRLAVVDEDGQVVQEITGI